jgi:hypothetical protein
MKIKKVKETTQTAVPNNEPPARHSDVADIGQAANPLPGPSHPSTPGREMQHLLPGPPGFPQYNLYYPPYQAMPHAPFFPSPYALQPQFPHVAMYPNSPWPQYGHAGPVTPTRESPSRHTHSKVSVRGSSPPLPDCDIHEFCATYDLDHEIEKGLEALGFHIGDDLESVSSNEWESVGIKVLARVRTLKAYNKFKNDVRK